MSLVKVVTMKLPIFLVASVLIFSSGAFANTLLNIDHMGEPLLGYEARGVGMGNTSIALFDGLNTSLLNPAVSAQLTTTLFTATYLRYQTKYSLGGQESAVVEHNLPNVAVTAFIPKIILPVTVGYHSYYDWGVKVVQPLLENGEEIGEQRYIGSGSVNAFSVSAGKTILPWLSLGLRLDYYFGAPKQVWVKDFSDENYSDVRDILEHKMQGPSFTVGAIGNLGGGLDLGFFYQHKAQLDVQDTVTSYFGEVSSSSYSITYPARLGVGVAYSPFKWLTMAMEVIYTRWSGFSSDVETYNFNDTTEFHYGMELVPSQDPKAFKLWRLPYRLGFYYIPFYGTDSWGGKYKEMGVTFGMGYYFRQNENSRVDVAFEFGKRGGGGVQLDENIFRLYFSVSALEKWLGKFIEEE